jgi:DNA-binding NarL/FixJ family response regulator
MVLVIDDDEIILRALRRLFRGEAVTATNGDDGVRVATEIQPRVILLDINLDGENGLELIPELRRVAPSAKVIVFTSRTSNELRSLAFEAGAHAFVDKVHVSRITEVVSDIVSGSSSAARRASLH